MLAGNDLTGKAGQLVKLINDNGTAYVKSPGSISDLTLFVVIEGGAALSLVSVRPLDPGRNVRLVLSGTCLPGDVLVLGDVTAEADRGKVRALPTAAGTYRGLAIAEEAGVDGQLVLARPAMVGNVVVT
jgi:hypothetical protein